VPELSELQVNVVAADRAVWSGPARLVIARTSLGDIGVMPGHQPVLATLADGTVTVRSSEGDAVFAVHGGFISVAHNTVAVLAETAERAEEIDVERARRALERAQAASSAADEDDLEHDWRNAERRAESRLRAAEGRIGH